MNRKTLKIIGIVTLISILSIVGTVSPAMAITNGQPDDGAHPYVGLVVFDVGGVPAWRTTGILISPTVVLTAGHGTDGADGARVWFDEIVQGNPEYPFGGLTSVEGTPYTNPDFSIGDSRGPGFATHDIGVVILDEPVIMAKYGELPTVGLVDTLSKMTDVDLVGYGLQNMVKGGGQPYWTGERVRLFAPAKLLGSEKAWDDEFVAVTANPGQGKGGAHFGDSGGPVLLGGTDIVLALHSYVNNMNAAGITHANRVDIQDILDWIEDPIPGP
jgi:hypothetical protein